MAKAKAEREKALKKEREQAATMGVLPSTGQDSMMTLDFGVNRLYPVNLADEHKDPLAWQNTPIPESLFSQTLPFEYSAATQLGTDPSGSTDPTVSQAFGDTLMDATSANPRHFNGSSSSSNTGAGPLMDDGSQLNWANWDDMVQEFGLQFETGADGGQPVPSVFGSGANWY